MIAALSLWLTRWAFVLSHRLSLYGLKSKLYRFFFEGRFREVLITGERSVEAIVKHVRREAWRADGWRSLYDAISYPGKAELVFRGHLKPSSDFDCDDFAVWAVAKLRASRGQIARLEDAHLLTVVWREPSGKTQGHNVAAFLASGAWWAIDYDKHLGPYASVEQLAETITHRYAENWPQAKRVGHALHTLDLRCVHAMRGVG